MKKEFVNVFVSVLILSFVFQPASALAVADSRVNEPISGISNNSWVPSESLAPKTAEKTWAYEGTYPPEPYMAEKRYEIEKLYKFMLLDPDLPKEVRASLIDRIEHLERPEYIPPTPEIIAQTQVQVESFDCSSVSDVPEIECEALLSLFASTNGAGWTIKDNWLNSTTVGNWYGIALSQNHVTQIHLGDNELIGIIPTGLGNLTNLQSLGLGVNQLTGTIPSDLGNLSSLYQLSLSLNQLTGNIPTWLGGMTNLQYLFLDDNQFSGVIPAELVNMSSLKILDLSSNPLSGGSIPTWLGSMTSLNYLSLNDIGLTGPIPPELSNLPHLYGLYLSMNPLSGSIPTWLGSMKSLALLSLSDCQLSGPIPSELGGLTNLYQLYLLWNQLSGPIPPELGNLTRLEELSLERNPLTSPIPSSFVHLTVLKRFNFRDTNLCEPTTPEFLAWKATVDYWYGNGKVCTAPIELTGIEVTQAIQNLYNDVVLIKNKPTVVRVYVRSTEGIISNVKIELIAKRPDGTLIGRPIPPSNTNGRLDVYETNRRDILEHNFYFKLPSAWLNGDVVFEVMGKTHELLCLDKTGVDNDCKAEVSFVPSKAIDIVMVPVSYEKDDVTHIPDKDDLRIVAEQIKATFPISNLNIEYHQAIRSWLPWTITSNTVLMNRIKLIRLSECGFSCDKIYFGVIVDPPESGWVVYGRAFPKSKVATGFFTSRVIPHELAHIFGREHTKFDNELPPFDNNYPYEDATISGIKAGDGAFYGLDVYGLDILSRKHVFESNVHDLMTYDISDASMWPSDYTYRKLFENITNDISSSILNVDAQEINPGEYQIISGQVFSTPDSGFFDEIIQIISSDTYTSEEPGPYEIQLLDSSDLVIDSFSFNVEMSECPDCVEGEMIGAFVQVIPFHSNVKTIQLLFNETVLDSRTASAYEPVVDIVSPNGGELIIGDTYEITWDASDLDGDLLSYVVQYSTNDGTNWQTLITNHNTASYIFSTTDISGSENALIRVMASDGFHIGTDTSDSVFSISKHTPEVVISSPTNSEFFVDDQNIIFSGSGYDKEDGLLSETSLVWSSNIDGDLGYGVSIDINALDLTEGNHVITLTGLDTDGQSDTAVIEVTVYREPIVLPATLIVGPNPVYFNIDINQQINPGETLFIRNYGDGEMTWSASVDQGWVILDNLSDSAPSEVLVSVDPVGLFAGKYEATISITAPFAIDSPQEIKVYLTINDNPSNYIFLPLIMR